MRSLLPKEHGAYAQLLAPLVATVVAFGITPASAILMSAACLTFAAHEPLLVLLGHRGRRAKSEHGPRAERRLAVLLPIAMVAAFAGLAIAPPAALVAAGIVALPATVFVILAWCRAAKTLGGELLAALLLPGAAAPVAIAAGAAWPAVALAWIGWTIGYASTVFAIHRIIARDRSYTGLVVACAAAVGAACWIGGARAAVPLLGGTTVLAILGPGPRYLRPIGFALVGVSLISVALS